MTVLLTKVAIAVEMGPISIFDEVHDHFHVFLGRKQQKQEVNAERSA